MSKLFNLRPPRIRISGKGIHIVKPSVSVGGKHARVNLGSRGPSVTVGTRGASYNTRRGCVLSQFTWIGWLFGKR